MSGEARNIRRNRSTVSARVHCLPSLCFILHHFHSLISFASHLLSHGIIFPHFISNQFFPFSFCLPFNSLECACFNPFRLFIFAFTFFHAFVIVFLFHIPFHEKKVPFVCLFLFPTFVFAGRSMWCRLCFAQASGETFLNAHT